MILRLVTDVIRRQRWMYLLISLFALMIWTVAGGSEASTRLGLTVSLALVYFMGPTIALATTNLRELRVLPLTSRALWLTTCTVSTIVGPLVMLAGQSLAVTLRLATTGSRTLSAETMFLSSVYAFAYAGTLLPIGPLLGYAANNIESRKPRWLWSALTTLCFLVFIGGFGLPWLFGDALPLAFDQFTATSIAALAACLTMTGVAWVWTPKRGGIVRAQSTSPGAASAAGKVHRFTDRFTGIPRILVSHAGTTLALSLLTIGAFVAYWVVAPSGERLIDFLQRTAVLPFETPAIGRNAVGDWTVLLAFVLIAGNGVWNPWAKHLKVLPLSVRRINVLFVATPLLTWTLLWTVLIVVHIAVIGRFPDTLRLGVLVFAAGTSALGHTAALRMRQQHGAFPWFVMPIGIAAVVLTNTAGGAPTIGKTWVLTLAGLAGFAVAALLNHRILTRSTSSANAYRHQQPIGVIGPGVPR